MTATGRESQKRSGGRNRGGEETRLAGRSSEIVPQIVPQPVSTLDEHCHLPRNTEKHLPGAKSLKGLRKRCFGTSRGGSSAPLSKRPPSTTRTSLRVFRISSLQASG
jgi:hypothetical protein